MERLRAHIEALSGMESRYWNSLEYLRALEYAEKQFRSFGYHTNRVPFAVGTVIPSVCFNLVSDWAAVDGVENPEIIIGAHLDSIVHPWVPGSLAPGADDNASGCAILLEAARLLAERTGERRVRFVLFGAEEIGFYGSQAYVNAMLRSEKKALREVWILDQVGLDTRSEPTLKLEGYKTRSGRLMARVEGNAGAAGLLIERTYRPYGSDHMPFLRARIPTLLLIQPDDEDDPHNHSVRDTPDRLDYEYMARVLDVLVRVISGQQAAGSGQ